jgi:hypothetical protein
MSTTDYTKTIKEYRKAMQSLTKNSSEYNWYKEAIMKLKNINKGANVSLIVPKGTKVLSENNALITLKCDTYIDNAYRDFGGVYVYKIDGTRYQVSAGLVTAKINK